ncbi:hypothetical protein [Geomesophilobacter sediminis]|uniref:Cytochrome c7-like domain-containing protein n=1 Tax=Geomesophilobacter sediminis TaxID=2798584 RepID=A0A8J7M3B1_9BACT|nr:hypothetical protein [Geomesophilobacter sediminis]MBJ6727918.1 hypothetical protein [Geomesophilobacter sediminis]
MSQINKTSPAWALVALMFGCILSLGGCGDASSQSDLDPESGAHPAGWLPAGHVSPALSHINTCQPCHGDDFSGGISKVACTQCHLGDQIHVHPLDWDNLVYARHATYVNQHGAAACANAFCHGTNLQGVAASGPSCTSCHIGGAFHVHPWTSTAQDLAATPPLHAQFVLTHGNTQTCRNVVCHGAQLQGVLLSGPPCSACHFGTVFP